MSLASLAIDIVKVATNENSAENAVIKSESMNDDALEIDNNLEKAAIATGSMDTLDLKSTQKKLAEDAIIERNTLIAKYKVILDIVAKANQSTNFVFDLIELIVKKMKAQGVGGYIGIGILGFLILVCIFMPMFSGIVKLSPLDWLVIIMSMVVYSLISYLKPRII